jgi:hypothetical protein
MGQSPVDEDRFGMPQAVFDAARESHGSTNPVVRLGMYVPTRQEVAGMPAGELALLIDVWIWESPTELIPTPEQRAEVRSVLRARPDANDPEVMAIIAECDDFLDGRDPERIDR